MESVLQRACLALVRAIDDDDVVATTYSALCVQALYHTPHEVPCPGCWARRSAITRVSVDTLTCHQCGLRIELPAAPPPVPAPDPLARFRDLLSPRLKSALRGSIGNDVAMEQLMQATKDALQRELQLLKEATTHNRHDALWQVLHLLHGQGETFDVARLSTRSQRAMRSALALRRGAEIEEGRLREVAIEVSAALREMLRSIDP